MGPHIFDHDPFSSTTLRLKAEIKKHYSLNEICRKSWGRRLMTSEYLMCNWKIKELINTYDTTLSHYTLIMY